MKKKYDIDDLKKRVFIREYKREEKYGEDVSFEEWMNTIENRISIGHGEYPAIIAKNRKEHDRFLKQIETLASKYENVIEWFHEKSFKDLLEEARYQNQVMKPMTKKDGRIPIPGIVAIHLLKGMEISKKETGGYELFRIYYHHALKNSFNMAEREEYFANGYWPEGTKFDRKHYELEKGYHNYFPTVPASPQPNNDWARSLKQSLRKIIENEKR